MYIKEVRNIYIKEIKEVPYGKKIFVKETLNLKSSLNS